MSKSAPPIENIDLYANDARYVYEDGNLTVVKYDKINFQQLIDLKDKDKAIVLIPISPMEIHGKYLPLSSDYIECYLGLDLLKGVLKKDRPESKYTLVEFPGIPIGTGTNRGHPGTIHNSRKTVYELCKGVFDSLVRAGFRKILILSVHHGMIHAFSMEEAANAVMRKYKHLDVRILSPNHMIAKTIYMDDPKAVFSKYIEKLGQRPLSEEELRAINIDHHAGLMEIAFVSAINEKLVDPVYKSLGPNVEKMDAQLKGLIFREWAAHPPKEPLGCGYNADPSFYDKRDWYSLFAAMISDVGLTYIDALAAESRELLKPLINMEPWRQKKPVLELARRLVLPTNSCRNLCIIPLIVVAIIVPWLLYFLKP
ncbi:MAG: creatininase family protein [Candidatus Lokiarchaeota archaeon]|nr:creatininase family protein [Candidatus Lokiarchaeota archaeon]